MYAYTHTLIHSYTHIGIYNIYIYYIAHMGEWKGKYDHILSRTEQKKCQ